MKKILDILIIVLITLFVVNLFNGNKEKIDNNNKVLFKLTQVAYNIPASLKLNVTNNTVNKVSINTCDNIKINFLEENLSFSNDFCKDLVVQPGELKVIDYASEYTKFSEVGKYILKVNLGDKEYIEPFEIENKGTISKIFTELFYAPVYNLLIFLVKIFNNSLGWAIIGITIIIRILLLWPQHRMMLSQKKLQAIQPKIKDIQEKHKHDKQMLGKEVMDLYRREKVNPMGSCGFLLIQMPILIVLYNIILSIKDPSNYYYIYGVLTSYDILSMSHIFYGLDLLSAGGTPGLLLGIGVALAQYFQIKLSLDNNKKEENKKGIVLEKKKNESEYNQFMPDPDMMNKFMLYVMPAMVGVFTYSLFSGIGIYWGISTLFMLFQQMIVNNVLKK